MARAARERRGATHALAVLIELDDGPDRIDLGGTIWIGDRAPAGQVAFRRSRILGGREWVRLGAAELALDCLRRLLHGPAGGGADRLREDVKAQGKMAEHLFSGLKVIDCASWIAGPAAATIMSDFGADVIKIEPPGAGDPWRGRSANRHAPTDYYWQLTSRNKRSLALDLKHEAGRDVLYRLVAGADVFVTNFPAAGARPAEAGAGRPAAAQSAADLRVVHRLWRGRRRSGEDRLRFHRLLGAHRADGRGARRCRYGAGPLRAGHGRSSQRHRPVRRDRHRAVSAREDRPRRPGAVRRCWPNGLWANGCFVQTRLFGEPVPHRPPREQAPNALANHYRCRDGRWFIMALFNEERQLRPFLSRSAARNWRDDPRFATKRGAASRMPRAGGRTRRGVRHARHGGRGAAILDARRRHVRRGRQDWTTWRDDAQMRAIGALVPFADGEALTVSSPFQLDGEAKVAPRRAPAVGQHSEAVLREAGYSADEIERLRTLGVLA